MDKEFKFLFGFFMISFLATIFAVEPLIRVVLIVSQTFFGTGLSHVLFSAVSICFLLYPAGYWSIRLAKWIFKH